MRVRKFLCIVFACFMLVNCLGISAGAANVETQRDMKLVIERASGRFSLDVPANKTVGATTSFPLEAGEKVRIRATYSPESASVDFGLIDPDGLFHPLRATGGSFDHAIRVDQHGNYIMAIRNNSDIEIAVSGIVSYRNIKAGKKTRRKENEKVFGMFCNSRIAYHDLFCWSS